ncbi:MAG: hypothetical protein MUC64_03465 [Rubritepida sp.]|jgi:hypothetical protein|nr:hypothetical protein [Rubritepida sp.]
MTRTLTDEEVAAIAQAAGLATLHARFPGEVRAALATLAKHASALPRPADPGVEPTPAFRAPGA